MKSPADKAAQGPSSKKGTSTSNQSPESALRLVTLHSDVTGNISFNYKLLTQRTAKNNKAIKRALKFTSKVLVNTTLLPVRMSTT